MTEKAVGNKEGRKFQIIFFLLFFFIVLFVTACVQVVDDDLWFMSNRMIRHIYSKLDVDDYNFRIFRTSVTEVVKGTNCDVATAKADGTTTKRRVLRRRVKV